ncbi:hypothetical protein BCR44DRAFT_37421 [Catenaria anguillulae PL171]|uniref:Calponin-homology (CH) domain-containing protein n=1 Tax=Catenaria anguillulae PL171 TaxID=765915 RepID=A0A1Y2HGP8_9FUNG|nr:hypothetical protein BCR44DRAFT_37421 [Catenaria anguillulae PL171]
MPPPPPPPSSTSPRTAHSAAPSAMLTQPPAPLAPAAPGAEGYAGTPRSPGSLGLLSEEELTDLFKWVDGFPLSRPKRNFTRDFSDACLAAEIIHQLNPRLVELHNYPPANSTSQKIYNWNTLSFKVLRKLGCALTDDTIQQIVQCKPGIVETVLFDIRQKLLHMLATNPPPATKQPRAAAGAGTAMSHTNSLHDSVLYPQPSNASGPPPMLKRGSKGSNSHMSLPFAPAPTNLAAAAVAAAGPGSSSVVVDPFASGSGYQQMQQQQQQQAGDQEKDQLIATLKETVGILQEKIHKLELLLVLKDRKIQELSQ